MKNKPDFGEAIQAWAATQSKQTTPLDRTVAEAFRAGTLSETERMTVLEQVMGDDDQLQELLYGSQSPDREPLSEAQVQASWENFQQHLQAEEPQPFAKSAKPLSELRPVKLWIWQTVAAAALLTCALFAFQWVQTRNGLPSATAEACVRNIFFGQEIRGDETDKLPAKATTLRLHLASAWPSYGRYAVEILNADRKIVESLIVVPDENHILTLTIWTKNLADWKTYTLNVYGLSDLEKNKLGEKNLILSSIDR